MQRKPPFRRKFPQDATKYPNRSIDQDLVMDFLSVVTSGNREEIIRFLTKHKIRADVQHPETRESAYHIILTSLPDSSERELLDLIKTIHAYGPNVNLRDDKQVTPLHLACQNQYEDIVHFLCENGAKVNLEDSLGLTPLHYLITGKGEDCPMPDHKTKDVVHQGSTKPLGDGADHALEKLHQALAAHYNSKDSVFNKYFRHMQSTLFKFPEMDPEEVTRVMEHYMRKTKEHHMAGLSGEARERKMRDLEKNIFAMVRNHLRNKIDTALKEVKIEITDGEEAWTENVRLAGGDTVPLRLLGQDDNPDMILRRKQSSVQYESKLADSHAVQMRKLHKTSEKIQKMVDDAKTALGTIIDCNHRYKNVRRIYAPGYPPQGEETPFGLSDNDMRKITEHSESDKWILIDRLIDQEIALGWDRAQVSGQDLGTTQRLNSEWSLMDESLSPVNVLRRLVQQNKGTYTKTQLDKGTVKETPVISKIIQVAIPNPAYVAAQAVVDEAIRVRDEAEAEAIRLLGEHGEDDPRYHEARNQADGEHINVNMVENDRDGILPNVLVVVFDDTGANLAPNEVRLDLVPNLADSYRLPNPAGQPFVGYQSGNEGYYTFISKFLHLYLMANHQLRTIYTLMEKLSDNRSIHDHNYINVRMVYSLSLAVLRTVYCLGEIVDEYNNEVAQRTNQLGNIMKRVHKQVKNKTAPLPATRGTVLMLRSNHGTPYRMIPADFLFYYDRALDEFVGFEKTITEMETMTKTIYKDLTEIVDGMNNYLKIYIEGSSAMSQMNSVYTEDIGNDAIVLNNVYTHHLPPIPLLPSDLHVYQNAKLAQDDGRIRRDKRKAWLLAKYLPALDNLRLRYLGAADYPAEDYHGNAYQTGNVEGADYDKTKLGYAGIRFVSLSYQMPEMLENDSVDPSVLHYGANDRGMALHSKQEIIDANQGMYNLATNAFLFSQIKSFVHRLHYLIVGLTTGPTPQWTDGSDLTPINIQTEAVRIGGPGPPLSDYAFAMKRLDDDVVLSFVTKLALLHQLGIPENEMRPYLRPILTSTPYILADASAGQVTDAIADNLCSFLTNMCQYQMQYYGPGMLNTAGEEGGDLTPAGLPTMIANILFTYANNQLAANQPLGSTDILSSILTNDASLMAHHGVPGNFNGMMIEGPNNRHYFHYACFHGAIELLKYHSPYNAQIQHFDHRTRPMAIVEGAYPSIDRHLSDHFKLVKMKIIQETVKMISETYSGNPDTFHPAASRGSIDTLIRDAKTALGAQLTEISSMPNEIRGQIFYSIVVRAADNLINHNLNRMIGAMANEVISGLKKIDTPEQLEYLTLQKKLQKEHIPRLVGSKKREAAMNLLATAARLYAIKRRLMGSLTDLTRTTTAVDGNQTFFGSVILPPARGLTVGLNEVVGRLVFSARRAYGDLMDHSFQSIIAGEPKKNIWLNRVFNRNYLVSNSDQCYSLNTDLLRYLVEERGANVNARDMDNKYPLHRLIELQHLEAIEYLLAQGARVTGRFSRRPRRSSDHNSPLQFALTTFQYHNSFVYQPSSRGDDTLDRVFASFWHPVAKKLDLYIRRNLDKSYQHPPKIELAIPMTLLMYMENFSQMMFNYEREWSHQDQKDLVANLIKMEYLEDSNSTDMSFPLIEMAPSHKETAARHSMHGAAGKQRLRELREKEKKMKIKEREYQNQIDEMNKVIDEINTRLFGMGGPDARLTSKRQALNRKILLIQGKQAALNLVALQAEIRDLTTAQSQVKQDLHTARNTGFNGLMRNRAFHQSTPVEQYQQILETTQLRGMAEQNDHLAYLQLWENVVRRGLNHIRFAPLLMIMADRDAITMINSFGVHSVHNRDVQRATYFLGKMDDLHSKIIRPTIMDYYDLPSYSEKTENYHLHDIVQIYKHVIQTTMCYTFYYMIIKVIRKSLIHDPATGTHVTYGQEDITRLVKYLMNREGPRVSELYDYVINKLPEILLRSVLGIYKNEFEEDNAEDKPSLISHLEYIIDILQRNPFVTIEDGNPLIPGLKQLFEYQEKIFESVIKMMHQSVEGFQRYMINDGNHTRIMRMLLESASKRADY